MRKPRFCSLEVFEDRLAHDERLDPVELASLLESVPVLHLRDNAISLERSEADVIDKLRPQLRRRQVTLLHRRHHSQLCNRVFVKGRAARQSTWSLAFAARDHPRSPTAHGFKARLKLQRRYNE